MLLDENSVSIKLSLSTIKRDLRWTKQKTIQRSLFETQFGRLQKTEFKLQTDKFLFNSDRVDKNTVSPRFGQQIESVKARDRATALKKLFYSWERVFIEDKPEEQHRIVLPVLRREYKNRKNGKPLTNLLTGKVMLETQFTVKTAAGAIYLKNDIAQSKVKLIPPEQQMNPRNA